MAGLYRLLSRVYQYVDNVSVHSAQKISFSTFTYFFCSIEVSSSQNIALLRMGLTEGMQNLILTLLNVKYEIEKLSSLTAI